MVAMLRSVLIALLALVPALAPASPPPRYEVRYDSTPAPRSTDLMKQVVVKAHNETRAAYGSPPLVWNDELAADAMTYARKLAVTRTFGHDPQSGVFPRQGENLFMGTRGAYSFAEMMEPLIDEKQDFKPGRFPDVSRTGDWSDVGHYTQIVWPATTSVGCAVASNDEDDYLVCRYYPAGNVISVAMR
jgi:hypothetical protein